MGATVLPRENEIEPYQFLPSSRSVAFRRTAWEAVGGYPEWLDYGEDLVFDFALRDAGYRFVWTPDALVWFRPRGTLAAFFRQYYRYARGDGKADLWRTRHAIRYATYGLAAATLSASRRSHALLLLPTSATLFYLLRPILRLFATPPPLPPSDEPAFVRPGVTLLALAHIPLIRLVGDIAKMLGYPVGVAWRLQHTPPPQRVHWERDAGSRSHPDPLPVGEGTGAGAGSRQETNIPTRWNAGAGADVASPAGRGRPSGARPGEGVATTSAYSIPTPVNPTWGEEL
jgi:hypothetical protein